MAVKNFTKLNDLSGSAFMRSHLDEEFKSTSAKAVAFGRVSIAKNKDSGNSDLAQLETIEKYAEDHGYEVVRAWDVAETGHHHSRRTKFREMIEFVRSSSDIKHVIFSHQSRSNRNRESARELEALVRQHGVTIHCARDRLTLHAKSGIEDWLRWDVFNVLNEKFSKDHKRNVLAGMQKRIEMGLCPFQAPFGYVNRRRDDLGGLSVFEVVEDEAHYVRSTFELFATGRYSIEVLRRELGKLYPAYSGKISIQRIGDMLRNPFYHGFFRIKDELYQGHPEYHPRFITKGLFDRVQTILAQPRRSRRKISKREHPYLGLVKCGGKILDSNGCETGEECGCSVTAEEKRKRKTDGSTKTYIYYHCNSIRRCSQQDKRYATQHGFKLNYHEADLEMMFARILQPLTFTPDVVSWMQDHLLKEHHEKSGDHRQASSALLGRRTMLQRYIDQAYEDKLRGEISAEAWREKNVRWKAELEDVLEEIKHLDEQKDSYIDRGVELIELVHDLENIYKNAKPEKKRRIIEIVSSNHVLVNGTLRFDYRKPFDLLAAAHPQEKWWTLGESNSWPPECKSGALPAKLRAHASNRTLAKLSM